jgi:hypothetical protein
MLFIAIANGALRQFTFGRVMPELRAHQLSTLIGSVLIGSFIWYVISRFPPSSNSHAILIGVMWLCFTVVFEFFMRLVLSREPLSRVLHDYNLVAGRVWVLFLIWLVVAPLLFNIIHGAA